MSYDQTLQAHRGKWTENWCFSVTPLDTQGEKVMFSSPYEYEKMNRSLIQDEQVVEAWHARVSKLAEANGGKWSASVPEPLHWNMYIERDVRAQQLDHMIKMDRDDAEFQHALAEDVEAA